MGNKNRNFSMFDGANPMPSSANIYRNSLAILIAINDYPYLDKEYQLMYPEEDAKRLAKILTGNFGFKIYKENLLLGKKATKKNIELLLNSLNENAGKDDAVFLFFSGHGMEAGGEGYIIPADGRYKEVNSWITASWMIQLFKIMLPYHIFFVGDMCHAGTFLNSYFISKESNQEKNVQLLLSSAVSQQAPDKSIFAEAVCDGLMGQAGERELGKIYASELMHYVETEVEKQSPNQAVLGDFVIRDIYQGEELFFKWQVPVLPANILCDMKNPSPDVRVAAIHQMMSNAGQSELSDVIFGVLSNLITSDQNPDVMREAISALGKLHHPDSLKALVEILMKHEPVNYGNDSQDPVLFTVTGAMEELQNPNAIIFLAQFLLKDEPTEVSKTIARIAITNLASYVKPENGKVISSITALATNQAINYRDQFISNLQRIGGDIAINGLMEIIGRSEIPVDDRRRALFSIASIGNQGTLEKLENWISFEKDNMMQYEGQKVIETLKKRIGILEWNENELMYDDGVVAPDFPSPILKSALDLESCSRLSALVEIITRMDTIPVGDRRLAAISLMANESGSCDTERLRSIIKRLKETARKEENKNIIQNIKNALKLFTEEIKRRG